MSEPKREKQSLNVITAQLSRDGYIHVPLSRKNNAIAPADMISAGLELGIITFSEGFAVRKLINMLFNPIL